MLEARIARMADFFFIFCNLRSNICAIIQLTTSSVLSTLQAFGAVEAMSDRYCSFYNETVRISAEDLNSCCESCGMGYVCLSVCMYVCMSEWTRNSKGEICGVG